jgi:anti-sigma factor RsiW
MLNCRTIDPLVTRFVDDQLPDADRKLVEQHVRVCAPCHSRVLAEGAVHDLIREHREALGARCAPDALHRKCEGFARLTPTATAGEAVPRTLAAGERDAGSDAPVPFPRGHSNPVGSTHVLWRSRLAPLALAASLLLGVGAAFLYQFTATSSRVMAAELAADHLKCFAINGVLPPHGDAVSVESSMLSGFGWHMHLPAGAPSSGLELVGSRPCFYAGGKVAHIMYRHGGKPVSLFMLPRTSRPQEIVEVFGHRAAIWCDGERTFVLITREPQEEVERMASVVRTSMH